VQAARSYFSTRRKKIQKPVGAKSDRSSKNACPSNCPKQVFVEKPGHEDVWQGVTIWILK
jgi:hypothetical protein